MYTVLGGLMKILPNTVLNAYNHDDCIEIQYGHVGKEAYVPLWQTYSNSLVPIGFEWDLAYIDNLYPNKVPNKCTAYSLMRHCNG